MSTTERAESVSLKTAMPAYLQGVKEGKTIEQIAEGLGMNGPSLQTKISTARTQYMVATRVYADPDTDGATVSGQELMQRLNVDARQLKKNKELQVITEGKLIPGAATSSTQRTTGGVAGLVDLMGELMGSDEDSDEDEADTTAETAENVDGEDSAENSAE